MIHEDPVYIKLCEKKLTDNQINQIGNLRKLILSLFCLVVSLSCNSDKKNMVTKKICNITRY